jgi:hypothetical protein
MRLKICAVVLASLALAPPASGRSITSAAVALDRRQEVEAAEVGWALRTFLQNDPRADYVDLAAKAEGDGPAQRALKADQAKASYAKGLEALDEMDVPTAIERFTEAEKLLEQSDLALNMPLLLDVMAAKALALHARGEKAEAGNEFSKLYTLKPYTVDPKRLTPEASATVEEVRSRIGGVPSTILEVQTPPAAAWVFVDGVYQGVSPLEAKGFAPGMHYITAIAPGYDQVQERHVVGPGLVAKVAMSPSLAGQALLAKLRQAQAALVLGQGAGGPEAAAVAQWAKADEVLVVGVRRVNEAIVVSGLRVAADGRILAAADRELGTRVVSVEIEEFARTLLASDVPRAAPLPVTLVGPSAVPTIVSPPLDLAGSGFRGSGIALVSIGGLVVTAGVVSGVLANQRAADARAVPQVDKQAKAQVSANARDLALAADLCYVGGAIVGAAGIALVVLGALDAKKPAKPEPVAPAVTPSKSKPREQEKEKDKDKEKKRDKDKELDEDDLHLSFGPTAGGAAILLRGVF